MQSYHMSAPLQNTVRSGQALLVLIFHLETRNNITAVGTFQSFAVI